MYNSPVPLMIIRSDVDSLIEVNGQLIGECKESSFVAMPISDTGDYYICAIPLYCDDNDMRYSVTRKVCFENGTVSKTPTGDVKIFFWPGGVFELCIKTGHFKTNSEKCFPYTLSSIMLDSSHELTLYYENGLKLAMTNGNICENCAFSLGAAKSGMLKAVTVCGINYTGVFTEAEGKERLLLFDKDMNNPLDITADSISVSDDGKIIKINRLNTIMKHEVRTEMHIDVQGCFVEDIPSTGFYTHKYAYPTDTLTLAVAFCEAVRENFRDEALNYLSDELKAQFNFDLIKEFFGDFHSVRPPLSENDGTLLGLITHDSSSVRSARLFEFKFENMKITNISEY
ncbi:MAG: hypothetical protein IJO48_05145 [Clostridia bacterium]|nr:hypothetical protein [Clostridia bacterium]